MEAMISMKIYYTNAMSRKMTATVWVNDKAYALASRSQIEVKVKRDDVVKYRVGRLSALRTLDFQSPDAIFAIEPNKKLQGIYIAIMLAVLLGLWYLKQANTWWVTLLVVVMIFGYEITNYFRGYIARPVHV